VFNELLFKGMVFKHFIEREVKDQEQVWESCFKVFFRELFFKVTERVQIQ